MEEMLNPDFSDFQLSITEYDQSFLKKEIDPFSISHCSKADSFCECLPSERVIFGFKSENGGLN